MSRPSIRSWLPPLALHLLIALVATFPMALDPFERLVGHEDVDVWNHAWGPWWYWESLSKLKLPFFTDLLMAPRVGPLWYIDPLGALGSCLLVPITGTVFAYNAWILFSVALASFAARRLARLLGASDDSSWLAAVAATCTPTLISEIHNGVSEAVGIAWAIFALTSAWQAFHEGRWRNWIGLGFWGAITAVGTYYYAVATGFVIALWALAALTRSSGLPKRIHRLRLEGTTTGPPVALSRQLGGLALSIALASALLAPVAWAIHRSVSDLNSVVMRGALARTELEMLLAHNAVDPRTFLWPGDFQSVDYPQMGEAFRHSSYLGIVALALAFSTHAWLRPRALGPRLLLLLGLVLSVVMALGPWLWWDNSWALLPGGQRLALPFRALLDILPSSAATHPQRLALPAIVLVGVLAAIRACSWRRRFLVIAGLALALDGLLIGPSPWPLARTPVLDFTAHETLGQRTDPAWGRNRLRIILDLPVQVGETMTTSRYLLYQTVSHRPIPYRPDAIGGTSSLMGVPTFWQLALPSTQRPQHLRVLEHNVAKLEGKAPPNPQDLPDQGVAWIVVHRELERGTQRIADVEKILKTAYGEPELFGEHAVYSATGRGPR